MSSARWVMVLGLLGASGCGGIPIVSGDPFLPDAPEEREVDVSMSTDRGRDADPTDAPDASRLDAPDASRLDAPDASRLDAPDASTLDAPDATDSDQPEVRGVDAQLAEVARAEVFVNDSAMVLDIELPADDAGGSCALCPRGGVLTCCGARCRDLQTDRSNCGACGVVCPGTDDCVAGSCRPPGCPTGAVLCGSACFDLLSSPTHCGSCLLSCAAGQSCILGVCLVPFDAAVRDVASFDTGGFDAGAPDVGSFDAGVPDVGSFDAGVPDVSLLDRTTPILGADGGIE